RARAGRPKAIAQRSHGEGDAEMTATSHVFQASTSCPERNTALAVELTEVLGRRNPAGSAPPCRPRPSSQRSGGSPQCVAALNIARTAVAKCVAKTGVLRSHDRCPKFLKSVSEVRSITELFIAPVSEPHPREPSRSNSCLMPEFVQ